MRKVIRVVLFELYLYKYKFVISKSKYVFTTTSVVALDYKVTGSNPGNTDSGNEFV